MIIGGLFFIIPLLLILMAVKKTFLLVLPAARKLSVALELHTILGKASVIVVCIFLILLICLFGGYLVQKGFVKKWGNNVEEKLFILFPSFQILKYRVIDDQNKTLNELWDAILFKEDSYYKIAFITEYSESFITIFIPDAPKMDAGEVRYVPKDEFEYHKITMKEALSSLYGFGKGIEIGKKLISK